MKICRFKTQTQSVRYGVVRDSEIYSLVDQNIFASNFDAEAHPTKLSDAFFFQIVSPSKIVCVGRNYAEHARELGNEVPAEPPLFLKAPSSLIMNDEAIVIPAQSNQVEHEGELAVVIKKAAKNLDSSVDPLDYVLGFTCLNDVTARDLQRRDVQFTRAKSFDTFCPLYNFLETDLNPDTLQVTVRVNGETKQNGNTAQMVFKVADLIVYISQQMTLLPGDIIATGTPAGVSKLNAGDVCEVEIENIGVLQNQVTALS